MTALYIKKNIHFAIIFGMFGEKGLFPIFLN